MKIKNTICTIVLLLTLTSCAGAAAGPTATSVDVGAIQTAAVQDALVSVTQTVSAYTPTVEPTATIEMTPTVTVTATLDPSITITPTIEVECYQMHLLGDTTIPDGTEMTSGQEFVKTWHVKNTGPCKWTTSFIIVYGWGENNMGAQNTTLTAEVAPDTEADISINLKAPTQVGTYTAFFRLETNNGIPFGDTISAKIVVK